jgi:hypothetical protein
MPKPKATTTMGQQKFVIDGNFPNNTKNNNNFFANIYIDIKTMKNNKHSFQSTTNIADDA